MRSSSFFVRRRFTHCLAASLAGAGALVAACTPTSREFGSGAGASGAAASGAGGGGGMTGSSSAEVSSSSGSGGAGGSVPAMPGELLSANGFPGETYLFGFAADNNGESVLAGRYNGSINFGAGELMEKGNSDLFVARHDAVGSAKFANSYGDMLPAESIHTATGSGSTTLLTGDLVGMGTITFGANTHSGAGVWIAKLNPDGTPFYSTMISAPNAFPTPYAIATGEAQTAVITGFFQGSMVVGGTTLSSAGDTDTFYIKMDPTGAVQWAKRAGGMGHDNATGVAIDAAENIYMVGYFTNSIMFGMAGGTLTSAGGSDIFITKMGMAGAPKWGKTIGGIGEEFIFETVAVTPAGEVVVAASAVGEITVEGKVLPAAGGSDIYIVKLNTDGTMLWAQRYGDGGEQNVYGVAFDPDGNILVTGVFTGVLDFGAGAIMSGGAISRGYVAKLDPGGTPIFVKAFDGEIDNVRVAADGKSGVLVAGSGRKIAFSPGQQIVPDTGGVFLARFAP